jgi:hypothetical protein
MRKISQASSEVSVALFLVILGFFGIATCVFLEAIAMFILFLDSTAILK